MRPEMDPSLKDKSLEPPMPIEDDGDEEPTEDTNAGKIYQVASLPKP